MAFNDNPYEFNGHEVERPIPRTDLVEEVKEELLHGRGSGYLLGGKGMGKTVFLKQLKAALEPDCTVVTFERAPGEPTIGDAKRALVECLIDTCDEDTDGDLSERLRRLETASEPQRILYEYVKRKSSLQTLVLLYDELDTYNKPNDFGERWFGIIEQARKNSKNLKAFAAGGLGTFRVLGGPGSPFRSGSKRFILTPISRADLSNLAEPFRTTGQDIKDNILDAIMLHSGGNPRIATYGLQKLWRKQPVNEQEVVELYARFKIDDDGLRHTRRLVADTSISPLPSLFGDAILTGNGTLDEAKAQHLMAQGADGPYLEHTEVLNLLASAGLAEVLSAIDSFPINVRAIPSILNFSPAPA